MGVNVEISGRENSKELLRPESMVNSLAFGQALWDDPLKNQEDRTVWLAKWEISDGMFPSWRCRICQSDAIRVSRKTL
jgi:hypothetical protein